MSTTLTPSTPTSPSGTDRPRRSAPPAVLRRILIALALFVVIAGIGLGIALVTTAAVAFNVLVFAVFIVLWIAFAAAVAFSPATLDDLWRESRQLPVTIQGVVWLLFLPIMIGLWIWERPWSLPIRLVLVLMIGAWTIILVLPRSL